ncbi:hypothetical protein V6N11_035482 [Hibiscus sabdariffa]|uniref:Uncharacterized protein n=1 Tax=Hibiscus sabdariffa TaxID=183260 RepID=A0ABR2R0Z4_9ROSI
MVEFDGSPLEPPLVQGVASTEYVETEQERLLIGSNKLKVFNELSVIRDIKSDDIEASTKILLDNDSTKGLLEQPKDKTIIFEVCGDLKGLMEQSQIQGAVLDSFMVAREVEAKSTQVFAQRNQELWKRYELYGIFEGTNSANTLVIGTLIGSNNTEDVNNGKENKVTCMNIDGNDGNTKLLTYEDEFDSIDYSKELILQFLRGQPQEYHLAVRSFYAIPCYDTSLYSNSFDVLIGGGEIILEGKSSTVDDLVDETSRQRQRAAKNEHEPYLVKHTFEYLKPYLSSLTWDYLKKAELRLNEVVRVEVMEIGTNIELLEGMSHNQSTFKSGSQNLLEVVVTTI